MWRLCLFIKQSNTNQHNPSQTKLSVNRTTLFLHTTEQHGLLSLQLLWSLQDYVPDTCLPVRGTCCLWTGRTSPACPWEGVVPASGRDRPASYGVDARLREDAPLHQEDNQDPRWTRWMQEHLQGTQGRQGQEDNQDPRWTRWMQEHLQGTQGRQGQEDNQDLLSVWREGTQLSHVPDMPPLSVAEVLLLHRSLRQTGRHHGKSYGLHTSH